MIALSNSNIATVELKKELNSEESSGNEIKLEENNSYALLIM